MNAAGNPAAREGVQKIRRPIFRRDAGDTAKVTSVSSLVIVPVPSASLIVALLGLVRWALNTSFDSTDVSPTTKTVNCFVVSAGRKVSVVVPIAVKSEGALAVPDTVA